MSSEELWSLTWQEFYARQDRYEEEQKRWDERFGLVAATYANCHLKEGAPAVKPGDFFNADGDDSDGEEMTIEQSIAHMKSMVKPRN